MSVYKLFYKNILIGTLELSKDYCYYKANLNNIKELDDEMIHAFLKNDMNYLHPFFETRINNMNKFNLDELKYETDNYELVKN